MSENQNPSHESGITRRDFLAKAASTLAVFLPKVPQQTPPTSEIQTMTLAETAQSRGITLRTTFHGSTLESPVVNNLQGTATALVSDHAFHWVNSAELTSQGLEMKTEVTDSVIPVANALGMDLRIHHYVWGAELPNWLLEGQYEESNIPSVPLVIEAENRTTFANDEERRKFNKLTSLALERITQIEERYGNRVDNRVVLNEPYGVPFNQRETFWQNELGDKFPLFAELLFKKAHDLNPDGRRILNDTLIESPSGQNFENTWSLAQHLVQADAGLDAIGMQCHFWARDFIGTNMEEKLTQLAEAITQFQSLGIEVLFTELDVRQDDLENYFASQEERDNFAASVYKKVIETGLENNVSDFTFFSLQDGSDWLSELGEEDARPGLFNEDGVKKPAYSAIQEALLSH